MAQDNKYQIKYLEVNKLIPYINNAKIHSDEQVKKIASSITEFGFINPVIIDKNNSIIAGHGRLQAAKILDLKKVPTIETSGLTEAQVKAYRLADNRLSEIDTSWDMELVNIELEGLIDEDFDVDITGFEFEPDINFESGTEEDQSKLDELEPKWIVCPCCNKTFDLRVIENG